MLQVKTLNPIFDEQLADRTVECPETYNIPALLSYVNAVPARAENEGTMSTFLQQNITSVKQGVGSRSARTSDMLANMSEKVEKLAGHGAALEKLIRVLEGEAPSWPFEGYTLEVKRKYEYKSDHRDRRYVKECGAQALARRVRHVAFDDVMDWDIQNCLFTVVEAISDRLDIYFPHSACKFEAVKKYNRDREAVLREVAGQDGNLKEAKCLVISVFNGKRVADKSDSKMLADLRKEGRLFRWMAASLYPTLYTQICEAPGKTWPEASMAFLVYASIEDNILQALVEHVRSKPTRHLSLHFDGVMVDKDRVGDPSKFQAEAEGAILDQTSYPIKLELKKHSLVLALIKETATAADDIAVPKTLLKDGNCIPAAVGHALQRLSAVNAEVSKNTATNKQAETEKTRSYKAVQLQLRCQLTPCLSSTFASGAYLLHAENGGRPHCVGFTCDQGGNCSLFDGKRKLRPPRLKSMTAFRRASTAARSWYSRFKRKQSRRLRPLQKWLCLI